MENSDFQPPKITRRRIRFGRRSKIATAAAFFVIVILTYLVLFSPPTNFPTGHYVKIEKGSTTAEIAKELKENSIIRSASLFKVAINSIFRNGKIISGYYYFPERESLFKVVNKMVNGTFGYVPHRITIPEGTSNAEIANLIARKISNFNKKEFLEKTKDLEGQLFPDTYFIAPVESTDEIIAKMNDNFKRQILPLDLEIKKSGFTLNEVLTIASLIEEETMTAEDRRLVSGVIRKRLAAKMPLQLDASFQYFLNKNTFELTKKDLRTDSPYNTYVYKGLPPGPITNPGLDSMEAALKPTLSNYWYYLSDKDSKIHYAETYAEHKKNISIYLK